ncbi:PREDICTED: transcription factor IIIB 90 kDa subunit-like isoform X1 [Fragaria vesca subsp. vesca]|uniref:transcription factor IIIB 90 kDa subunit-like isoform X1 n=1 Tax=Fragaria vesca subsp. vesca TaxID=101020 RepID=UPI0002C34437|nr:PREDICTED: transcription factor IIIB 90 kDa subunit-like isoform X1 [Fragaria vesca subsp. vesca]
MVWCSACVKNVEGTSDAGRLWCSGCGKVLEDHIFSEEPTFVKNAAGQSQLAGRYVRSRESEISASRERILENAEYELRCMRNALDMGDNEEIIDIAKRFYRIAIERNFTRGRKSEQVQAACLYIACREKKKPYLLIDFSNYLKINVYVLGAVFLQLCKALRLDEHPIVQKLVDPSWFIHRFTESLPGGRDKGVMQTAHRIITSMKRDWMQTGRKPSGICGAALYISALSHGLKCSKSDIIKIVHVCDATLTKRLVEFENTESGSLTIEEFLLKAKELDEISKQPIMADKMDDTDSSPSEQRILCEHKDSGKPYAHGLCQICYDDFMTISGGLDGGANPPAFQRAEIERLKKTSAELNANDSGIDTIASESLDNSNQLSQFEKENNTKSGSKNKGLLPTEPVSDGAAMENTADDIGTEDCDDESDNFSDIDDLEVDGYLLNEEGQRYKKMIWEEMNREYIEEQAAKEEAAKAAMDINCPEGAKKLAQITEAAVAKRKKERQLARAAEAKNSTPAQTAAEAVHQMLTKKRLSSKINFDVLEDMFETSEGPDVSKKRKIDSHLDNDNKMPHDSEELKYDAYKDDDLGMEQEYGDEEGLEDIGYNNHDYVEEADEYNDRDYDDF